MAIRQFEENSQSGYTIENIPTQNDKYKEKLVIAMSSGECPDMYTTWSGGPMNEYIDSGYAQPLDDLYEKYGMKERFMEGELQWTALCDSCKEYFHRGYLLQQSPV